MLTEFMLRSIKVVRRSVDSHLRTLHLGILKSLDLPIA